MQCFFLGGGGTRQCLLLVLYSGIVPGLRKTEQGPHLRRPVKVTIKLTLVFPKTSINMQCINMQERPTLDGGDEHLSDLHSRPLKGEFIP